MFLQTCMVAFISFQEIFDILIMVVAAGFIFMHLYKKPLGQTSSEDYDPLKKYVTRTDFWDEFKVAAIIAGPAIVLHELSHKFTAVSFGLPATLHAPYWFLAIAIILVLVKFPVIFFVGGYVEHVSGTPFQNAMISVAGPLVNLILWLGALYVLKSKSFKKKLSTKTRSILNMTATINMFLFIFNMLPIPGFDGFGFFYNLGKIFFGFP